MVPSREPSGQCQVPTREMRFLVFSRRICLVETYAVDTGCRPLAVRTAQIDLAAATQSRNPYLAFVHISSTIMSEAEGGCCGWVANTNMDLYCCTTLIFSCTTSSSNCAPTPHIRQCMDRYMTHWQCTCNGTALIPALQTCNAVAPYCC